MEQHPPWSYPVVIVKSKEVNLSHICVNKNMLLLICRVYQAVKMMTLPENKNQKKIRRGRRKEKKFIDSGNVLGWTLTVSKGTDVETLHKLLHLCFCFNGLLCCTVSLSGPNAICFFTKTWCKKIHIMICTTSQWCPDPSSKLILLLC